MFQDDSTKMITIKYVHNVKTTVKYQKLWSHLVDGFVFKNNRARTILDKRAMKQFGR